MAIIPVKGTAVSLVRLPRNFRALDIQLRQSHEGRAHIVSYSSMLIPTSGTVDLGAISRMSLVLSTGRNDISMATIKLSAPGGVKFDYANAQVQNPGQQPFICSRVLGHIWSYNSRGIRFSWKLYQSC